LLDVLSGRRALRIVDPEADVPVALDPVSDDPGSTKNGNLTTENTEDTERE
jgi:hypothetical protein